jgi:hypothetical protein
MPSDLALGQGQSVLTVCRTKRCKQKFHVPWASPRRGAHRVHNGNNPELDIVTNPFV